MGILEKISVVLGCKMLNLKGRAGKPRVNVPAKWLCGQLHCSIDQDWSSGSVPVTLNNPL